MDHSNCCYFLRSNESESCRSVEFCVQIVLSLSPDIAGLSGGGLSSSFIFYQQKLLWCWSLQQQQQQLTWSLASFLFGFAQIWASGWSAAISSGTWFSVTCTAFVLLSFWKMRTTPPPPPPPHFDLLLFLKFLFLPCLFIHWRIFMGILMLAVDW